MKTALIALVCLASVEQNSCGPKVDSKAENVFVANDGNSNTATIQFFEHQNHKFAVAISANGSVAICEVTPESLAEKPLK